MLENKIKKSYDTIIQFQINRLLPFLVSNRFISCRINKRWDEFNFFIVIYTAKASFNKYHSKVLKKYKHINYTTQFNKYVILRYLPKQNCLWM